LRRETYGEASFKTRRQESWENIRTAKESMDALSKTWTNKENVTRLGEITILLKDFEEFQDEIEAIAQQKKNVPAVQMLFTEAAPRAAIIVEQITGMIEAEKNSDVSSERKILFAALADFRGTMGIGLANIRAYLLSGENRFRESFGSVWEQNKAHFIALEKMQPLFGAKQQDAFAILVKTRAEFAPLPEKMFALRSKEDWNLANHWLKSKAAPKGERLITILEEMVADQHGLLEQDGEEIQGNILDFTTLLFMLLVVSAVASMVIATYLGGVFLLICVWRGVSKC
jgi:methyl-accepting chemotaxis protein